MDEKQANDSLNRKALISGSFFVIVQLMVRGLSFLVTPIYTRLVSTEQYAVIRIYESWLLIAVPVMSLCLYRSVPKAKFDFGERFNAYVSSVQSLSAFFAITVFAVITLFFRRAFMAFTGMDTLMYIYMLLFVIATSGLYVFQNREKQLMRYKRSMLITVLTMVPATLLSLLLLYWGNQTGRQDSLVQLRVIGFYTPQIIGGLAVIFLMWRDGRAVYDKACWKYSLLYSLPLVPDVLSVQIMNQADKIMIQKMVGDYSAGIFALATSISFIIWIVEDAVWHAWLPWLYEKISRGEQKSVTKPWLHIAVLFAAVSWALVALAPELVAVLGGSRYKESVYLVAPMVSGMLFRFYTYSYTAIQGYHKKTQYVAIGTVGVMFVNVALNWICILHFGYQAAAYTTAASYLLLLAVQGMLEKHVTGERIVPLSTMLLLSAAAMALNVVTMVMFRWKWYFRYAVIAAVGLLVLRFMLPAVKELLGQLKTKKRSVE